AEKTGSSRYSNRSIPKDHALADSGSVRDSPQDVPKPMGGMEHECKLAVPGQSVGSEACPQLGLPGREVGSQRLDPGLQCLVTAPDGLGSGDPLATRRGGAR